MVKVIVECPCDAESSKVRKVFEKTIDCEFTEIESIPFEKILTSLVFMFRDINPIVSFKLFM